MCDACSNPWAGGGHSIKKHQISARIHARTPQQPAAKKSRLDELACEELERLGVWEPLDRDRARRVSKGIEVGMVYVYVFLYLCGRAIIAYPTHSYPKHLIPQFFLRALALQESSGPHALQVDAELGLFLRQDERRLERRQRHNNRRIALLRRRVMGTAAAEVAVRAKVGG